MAAANARVYIKPVHRQRFFILQFLYYIASFAEYYDLQSISSCLRALEVSLAISPDAAAAMAMAEAISMASTSPIWGFFTDLYEPKYVLAFAMVVSGCTSIVLGVVSNYASMIFLRVINGSCMGSITPVTQRLLLSTINPDKHGIAFGLLHATFCFGRLTSAVLTTYLSQKIIMEYYGWRVCFVGFGIFEILIGFAVFFFMDHVYENPKRKIKSDRTFFQLIKQAFAYLLMNITEIFYTRTSKVLVLQTFVADAPFVAVLFLTLYLQYIGLSDLMSGLVSATLLFGGIIGGIFGGILVDKAHKFSPDYGRTVIAIISLCFRMLLLMIVFLWLKPMKASDVTWVTFVIFTMIGSTGMVVSCVDRPILADTVMPQYYASAIAVSRGIAGIASQLIFTPLAAVLASKVFGYETSQLKVENMSLEFRMGNAEAYRKSILYMSLIGSAASAILFVWFLFTVPGDTKLIKDRIHEENKNFV